MLKYKIVYTGESYRLYKKGRLFYNYIQSYPSLQSLYETLDKLHYYTIASKSKRSLVIPS